MSQHEQPAGRRIGPYLLKQELGRGSNGVVFVAENQATGQEVALKILLAPWDEEAVLRFRREASITAKIKTPGIVPTVDMGHDGSRYYYAMPYLPGPTLKARVRTGALRHRDAALLVSRLAATMASAHQWGVIHRDLKPSNIILDPVTEEPWVTDFGLARDYAAQRLTRTGDLLGTPVYMAPEQIRGEKSIDHRVDVYAMGVILYELLTGSVPYYSDNLAELAVQIKNGRARAPREVVPEISATLEGICQRAMAANMEERISTATELHEELQRYLEEGTSTQATARGARRQAQVASSASRERMLQGGALGAIVLLSVALAVSLASAPGDAEFAAVREASRQEALVLEASARLEEIARQREEGVPAAILLRELEHVAGMGGPELGTRVEAAKLQIRADEERQTEGLRRVAALEALNRGGDLAQARETLAELVLLVSQGLPLPEVSQALEREQSKLERREEIEARGRRLLEAVDLNLLVQHLQGLDAEPQLRTAGLEVALRALDQWLAAQPNAAQLILLRGLVLHRLGKEEQALTDWQKLRGMDHRAMREIMREFFSSGVATPQELQMFRGMVDWGGRGRRGDGPRR